MANLEYILNATPTAKNDRASPPRSVTASPAQTLDGSSLLRTSCAKESLRAYHPSPETITVLWDYYVRNVDILVKILYKPTVEDLVISATRDLNEIDVSTEALLFAIYFAAARSMSRDECLQLTGEHRDVSVRKYRYALEQALAQVGWMTTQEVVVLQALLLMIVSH